MSKVYYAKELVGNRVLTSTGVGIPFERLSGNRGVIELDTEKDAAMIAEVDRVVGRFGVYKISAEEYLQKKTRFPFNQSETKSQPEIRTMPRPNQRPSLAQRIGEAARPAVEVSPMGSISPPADSRVPSMPAPPNLAGPINGNGNGADGLAAPTDSGPPNIAALRPSAPTPPATRRIVRANKAPKGVAAPQIVPTARDPAQPPPV